MHICALELLCQGRFLPGSPDLLGFIIFKNGILLEAFDILVILFGGCLALVLMASVLNTARNAEKQETDVEELAKKFSHKHKS